MWNLGAILHNGKIIVWRFGNAAKGEPRIIEKVINPNTLSQYVPI